MLSHRKAADFSYRELENEQIRAARHRACRIEPTTSAKNREIPNQRWKRKNKKEDEPKHVKIV